MAKLYKNKAGETLYPVCSWEKNQHKLYNAYDRAVVACYDTDWSDKAMAERDRVEQAISAFDSCVINGLVYATYKNSQLIKDIVWAYDCRH